MKKFAVQIYDGEKRVGGAPQIITHGGLCRPADWELRRDRGENVCACPYLESRSPELGGYWCSLFGEVLAGSMDPERDIECLTECGEGEQ